MTRMRVHTSGKKGFGLTSPSVSHAGVQCRSCSRTPIQGTRWKCGNCVDYDLCESCARNNNHTSTHVFVKIKTPLPAGKTLSGTLLNKDLYS